MGNDKMLRGLPSVIGISLLIALLWSPLHAEFPPLECPAECSCHYFRIHWVSDCSMKGLTAIPSGLSASVYILDLSRNTISGKNDSLKYPPGSKVRRLHLAENKLTEITRDTFSGLNHLLEVDLSGNAIEKFDQSAFLDSPGLISLELRRNPLTGPERGKPFVTSRSLQNIDLSDCRLRHLYAGFFDEATAVSELDLSGNPLESIDPESFKPLTGLEKLQINRCLLTSIAPDLFQGSQHLKHFEAAWNPKLFATDEEPKLAALLRGLNRLDHLDLRGTGLRSIPSDSFKDTLKLSSLMLADNDISASSSSLPSTLSSLGNIHLLDLSGCHLQLSSLSFLSNMTGVRVLRLGRNDLSRTQTTPALADPQQMDMDWSISHLDKLKKLALDHCEIERLPSAKSLSALQNILAELDVSDNPLLKEALNNYEKGGEVSGTISVQEKRLAESIRALKSLQNLDMSRCNITHLPKDTFSKSFRLRRLSLSGNMLTTVTTGKQIPGLEDELLSSAYRLETLEIADCGFPELPSPETMPQPRRDEDYSVDTDKKKKKERVDDEEDAILDMGEDETEPYLREFNFAGNPLSISGPFPPYISSLTKMDLSRCGLSKIPKEAFLWAFNLTDLSLAGNPLGSSGKTIEKIIKPRLGDSLEGTASNPNSENDSRNNLTVVEIIHVDDKPAPPDLSFLSHLPNIRSLDLRRCNLTSLSHSSISNASLKSLRLAGNPWVCNCQLVSLWDWASSSDSDILLHRSPPAPIGSTVVAAASIEDENGLRCTATDGTRIPWSSYVLSSHQHHECGPLSAKLVAHASRIHQTPADDATAPSRDGGGKTYETWSTTALACSLGALILLMLIGGVWFVRSRSRSCQMVSTVPQGNALLLDEEELGNMGTVRWASKPYRETTQP